MNRLAELNEKNDIEIIDIFDSRFSSFGRIIEGYDFSEAVRYMEEHTEILTAGNVYERSDENLEKLSVKKLIETRLYGGNPVQIGYCNGKNSTYNGFEYHKCSEINVACTDLMMVLGHTYDICDNHYNNSDATVFFVPKGTVFEMYQTTLHLSPCRVEEEGFKAIVVLSLGTNTPLSEEEKSVRVEDAESELLLQRNKWVIAHPEREPLIKQGAFPGIIGENKELFF